MSGCKNGKTRRTVTCLIYSSTCVLITVAGAGNATPPNAKTKGFVITQLHLATYEGPTGRTASWDKSDGRPECPDGFNIGVDTEAFRASLPEAERKKLREPENDVYTLFRMRHRGSFNRDVCENPTSAPDPGFKVVQGKIAHGFNLDTKHSCEHENFVSPFGENGIDNQLYRTVGCIKSFRQGGTMYGYINAQMRQGDHTVLIELNDLDNLQNDDHVKVGVYASLDPMVNNVNDVSLTNASLRVHYNRNYHSLTHGAIVNGVLTTEPVNIQFDAPSEKNAYNFRDARLRVVFRPDGGIEGLLGGYQDVETVYRDSAVKFLASELRLHGPMTCPGLYNALVRMADGYPNRAGQCTWISSAYEFEAIPAFVIHPNE